MDIETKYHCIAAEMIWLQIQVIYLFVAIGTNLNSVTENNQKMFNAVFIIFFIIICLI